MPTWTVSSTYCARAAPAARQMAARATRMPGLSFFITLGRYLVSTTFRKHGKTFIDNVSKNNAMLRYLMNKGGFETIDGGLTIVRPLDYNSNAT